MSWKKMFMKETELVMTADNEMNKSLIKTSIFQWIMTCYLVICRKTQNHDAASGYWF